MFGSTASKTRRESRCETLFHSVSAISMLSQHDFLTEIVDYRSKSLSVSGDSSETGDFGLHIPHSLSQTLRFLPLRFLPILSSSSSISSSEVLPVTVRRKEYHPDVCKGNNYGIQFHRINEAYNMVMSNLREFDEDESYSCNTKSYEYTDGCDEPFRGINDSSWDLWEEWMGWEGARIREYSSHINPYI